MLSKIFAWFFTRKIDDSKRSAKLKKLVAEHKEISDDLDDKLEEIKESNPELYKSIQSRRDVF